MIRYGLILIPFGDHYIQVKVNEIVDSGSLKGDRFHYNYTGDHYKIIQVNFKVNIRHDF